MTEKEMMEKAKAEGWLTLGGYRWWKSDWLPEQNTWTWDRVKEELFPEESK